MASDFLTWWNQNDVKKKHFYPFVTLQNLFQYNFKALIPIYTADIE